MAAIDKAALALTQCWRCLGCERMESESFRGDDKCQSYIKADAATLIQRRGGEDTEPEQQETIWRPK